MENDKDIVNNTGDTVYVDKTARLGNDLAKAIEGDSSTCNDHLDSSIEQQNYPTFLIDGIEYKVKKISDSVKEGKKFGLDIKIPVTIYFLDGYGGLKKGAYRTEKNVIFMFDNADKITLKHEIIHSLELNKPIPDELNEFYEFVKSRISEDSFGGGMVSFNFNKNIHEFIADGYSKEPFINALKKEDLYNEFIEKTKYIFD